MNGKNSPQWEEGTFTGGGRIWRRLGLVLVAVADCSYGGSSNGSPPGSGSSVVTCGGDVEWWSSAAPWWVYVG